MIGAAQQIRNSLTYVVPVLVGNLLPLLTLPVFTRALPREDYGAWGLSTAYAVFVTGVANFGLTLGFERNFFEHRDAAARARLLYSTLAFVLAMFALAAGLTWWWRAPIARAIVGSADYAPLLVCTTAANAVMSLKAYYLIFFRNTGEARAHVWFSVDESIGAAALGVLFVAGLGSGVIGIPLGQLIASTVVFGALTARFVRRVPPAFSLPLLKDSLAISYPLTPRLLVGVAGNQIDKYLIGLLGTLGGVGIYTVGQRLAYIVFGYMTALENVFTPQVYERMFARRGDEALSVGAYLTPFAYVSVLAALLIGLFSEEVLLVLTPASYHGAVPIAAVLSLHYGIMFFGKLPQLVFARKTGLISVVSIAGLTANAVFNVWCIQWWGAFGAACGTLAAGLVSVALVVWLGQRHYPIRWESGRLAAIFGVLFAAVVAVVWMRQAGVAYAPRLAVKAIAVAAYVAAGTAIGVVSRENLRIALDAVRRCAAVPTPS